MTRQLSPDEATEITAYLTVNCDWVFYYETLGEWTWEKLEAVYRYLLGVLSIPRAPA